MSERKRLQFGRVSAIVGSAPCYGCNERTSECHISCERYTEYIARRDAVRENVVMESQGNPGIPDIRKKARDRYAMQKLRGRGK